MGSILFCNSVVDFGFGALILQPFFFYSLKMIIKFLWPNVSREQKMCLCQTARLSTIDSLRFFPRSNWCVQDEEEKSNWQQKWQEKKTIIRETNFSVLVLSKL